MGQSWRAEKRELTQTRIASAAVVLFAEHGFAEVSMGRVARAAGVAERTVFRYFGDKEELMFAEDREVSDFLADHLRSAPSGETPARLAQGAYLDLVGRWQDRHDEGRARQQLIESSPALRARDRAKLALHEDLIATALMERGSPPLQARIVAASVSSTAHATTLAWLAQRDPEQPQLRDLLAWSFHELATALNGRVDDTSTE